MRYFLFHYLFFSASVLMGCMPITKDTDLYLCINLSPCFKINVKKYSVCENHKSVVWIYGEIILIVICYQKGSYKVWKCRKRFLNSPHNYFWDMPNTVNSVKIRAIKIILGNVSPMCTQREMKVCINAQC